MLRRVLVAIAVAPLCTLACAQLLSYDDYAAREPSPLDTGSEVSEASIDAADAPDPPARLPDRPAGDAAASGGANLWLAVKHMYLGTQNALGVDVPEAWRGWGFDLDRVCTSSEDSVKNVGTCLRTKTAGQEFLTDGERCRDNNFGQHVVPLIKLARVGFEKELNTSLLQGMSTWLLVIEDLGTGADDAYAPGKLYFAAPTLTRPNWDGTDTRAVRADSVEGGDLGKPKIAFDKGFVKNHVWVSGSAAITLPTPLTPQATAWLRLEGAVITLELSPDHKSAAHGLLGGAIPLASVDDLLVPVASSGGFCPGSSLYQSAYDSVQRFPDLVTGAPNLQDTTQTCNAISIGIGFDVANVKPSMGIADPPAPSPNPCDAGPG